MVNSSNRRINIDLLRIFSMLLIVGHHYAVHGDFDFPQGQISLNRVFLDLVAQGGKLGVNLFVLTSGFFLIEERFKSQRILRLLLDIIIYSLLLFVIYLFLGGTFSTLTLLKYVLLPTFYDAYWFISIYILLLLVSPYLNLMIKSLKQEQLQVLIGGLLLIWSFLQTLVSGSYFSFSELGWFIILYLLGAYFRYYRHNFSWRREVYIGCSLGAYLLVLGLAILADITEIWSEHLAILFRGFMDMNSPLLLLTACGCFLILVDLPPLIKVKSIPLSSYVLGVYLIHDNQFIRTVLWQRWLDVNAFQDSPLLWLHCFLVIFLVFGLCMVLDWVIRKVLTGRLVGWLVKLGKKIDKVWLDYLPEA